MSSGEVAPALYCVYFDNAPSPTERHPKEHHHNPRTGITVSAGFAQTNDCPATLAVGATCTIKGHLYSGSFLSVTGTLSVTHDAR